MDVLFGSLDLVLGIRGWLLICSIRRPAEQWQKNIYRILQRNSVCLNFIKYFYYTTLYWITTVLKNHYVVQRISKEYLALLNFTSFILIGFRKMCLQNERTKIRRKCLFYFKYLRVRLNKVSIATEKTHLKITQVISMTNTCDSSTCIRRILSACHIWIGVCCRAPQKSPSVRLVKPILC